MKVVTANVCFVVHPAVSQHIIKGPAINQWRICVPLNNEGMQIKTHENLSDSCIFLPLSWQIFCPISVRFYLWTDNKINETTTSAQFDTMDEVFSSRERRGN